MRFDGGFDVMLERPVLRVGNVADAQQLLDLFPTFFGDGDVAVLLVDHEIAGELRRLARRSFDLLALFQLGDDAVYFVILVSRFLAGARDDQWRTGLIDKDRIDFIDDGVVMPARSEEHTSE